MVKTTVGAIITRKENGKQKILLTKRNVEPFKHKWCIPGGHVEPFEDAMTAVIREVKEETNLDFKPIFFTYMDEIFKDRKIHNVVLLFYGETSNILRPNPDEVTEATWCTLEEARQLDLAFYHNKALDLFHRKVEENLNS